MWDLRRTCKVIHSKTFDYFARTAFRAVVVRMGYSGLCKVAAISQHPQFAAKVQTILCYGHELHDEGLEAKEYDEAEDMIESSDVTPEICRLLQEQIRLTNLGQMDRSFVERSATDGIMLALAFQRFTNLKELLMPCVNLQHEAKYIRRKHHGEGPSTDHTFSILLSSAAHAILRPKTIRVVHYSPSATIEAVLLSTLSMPNEILCCLSELRELQLRLQTRSSAYRNPSTWKSHLATFLSRCPQLRYLTLSFLNDWEDTESVISAVATQVHFPRLEELSLGGIRCSGGDLCRFLQSHPDLRKLDLDGFDITGSASYASILKMLSNTHTRLQNFSSCQIAQNSFRVYLETLGKIGSNPYRPSSSKEPEDFFDDFEQVHYPHIFTAQIEEWEGVQQRLALMSEDLVVSHISYHPLYDSEQ